MNKIIFSFLLLMILINCNINKKSPDVKIGNTDTVAYLLKEKIVHNGDTTAYGKLSLSQTFKLTPWPLLYYSQIMCNKYKYPLACYDCYMINCEKYNPENLKSNDSLSYIFGVFYLLKANEMGFSSAKYEIENIFKNQNIPNSNDYLKNHLK